VLVLSDGVSLAVSLGDDGPFARPTPVPFSRVGRHGSPSTQGEALQGNQGEPASASEVTGGARSGPGPSRTDEPGREGLVLRSAMSRTRWAPSGVIPLARGPPGRPPGHERRPGAPSVASPSSSGTAPVRPSGSRRRPPARPAPERCRRTSPGGASGSRSRGRRPESRAPAGATARRRPGLGRAYRAADVLGRPRAR